jgi:predicted alpha/beta-hydrolase family hydrolase
MARVLSITTPLGKVSASLAMPSDPSGTAILVAHGAGAGRAHPWMEAMQGKLVAVGFPTMTFNYLYTEEGRKAPDRLPKLVTVHAAVAERFGREFDTVILAGKSMGGRVGGHVAAEGAFDPAGIAFLGYPLVAMGKHEPRDTSHLVPLRTPLLFVSGTRDTMGPNDLVEDVARKVHDGTFFAIDGGDHSFAPLKSSGRTLDDTLDEVSGLVADWWS